MLPNRPARVGRPRGRTPLGTCLGLALGSLLACAGVRPAPAVAVADGALRAFEEAREALHGSPGKGEDAVDEASARRSLLTALELEPAWVAPRRLLDDLERDHLLGIEILAEHEEVLAEEPWQAERLYLAGRLRGTAGTLYFRRAVSSDPRLAWGHHGLAWRASVDRRYGDALYHGRHALARARDSFERTFFTSALARYRAGKGQRDRALRLLRERLKDPEVQRLDRIGLGLQLVSLELEHPEQAERLVGRRRGLQLLRDEDLAGSELAELYAGLVEAGASDAWRDEVLLALAAREHPVRERLRAQLMLSEGPTPLAHGLLMRSYETEGRDPRGGPLLRRGRFAAGRFRDAVEGWLEQQPTAVLDEDGLPRDPALRRVVFAARALRERDSASHADLGDALCHAGWFREARGLAAFVGGFDLDLALDLEERALVTQDALEDLVRLALGRDIGEWELDPEVDTHAEGPPALDEILERMDAVALRLADRLEEAPEELQTSLSPRLNFGWLGQVVHPGPVFSAEDEALERGVLGERVPGVGALFARLGRFAVFGQGLGMPADGTILQRVAVEPRSGTHLGWDWSGTVAWCEGADLASLVGRRGADIAGAALHEGYWVDVQVLREDLEGWDALARDFERGPKAERLGDILATRGLRLDPALRGESRRLEACATDALLGEGLRIRLAILRDRAAGEEALGRICLDDLVEVTSAHEEAHLCDRARYLPLRAHLWSVLGLALRAGLTPTAIQERLEYRAQLVAMCVVPDPRIPLGDIVLATEGGSSVTPHAGGYTRLLDDFVKTLHESVEDVPEIDPEHVLAHQLHLLDAEAVRDIALRLALEEGMVSKDFELE